MSKEKEDTFQQELKQALHIKAAMDMLFEAMGVLPRKESKEDETKRTSENNKA